MGVQDINAVGTDDGGLLRSAVAGSQQKGEKL
jgi:hypothetical protein